MKRLLVLAGALALAMFAGLSNAAAPTKSEVYINPGALAKMQVDDKKAMEEFPAVAAGMMKFDLNQAEAAAGLLAYTGQIDVGKGIGAQTLQIGEQIAIATQDVPSEQMGSRPPSSVPPKLVFRAEDRDVINSIRAKALEDDGDHSISSAATASLDVADLKISRMITTTGSA